MNAIVENIWMIALFFLVITCLLIGACVLLYEEPVDDNPDRDFD